MYIQRACAVLYVCTCTYMYIHVCRMYIRVYIARLLLQLATPKKSSYPEYLDWSGYCNVCHSVHVDEGLQTLTSLLATLAHGIFTSGYNRNMSMLI